MSHSPPLDRDLASRIDEAVDARFPRIVELRRHLHVHPDPSGEEQETTRHLASLFREEGFETRTGPEGRGLIVEPPGQPEVSRLALRADIDALWIQDQKDVEYRSQRPGVMHACGHDAHTSLVAGAVLALHDLRREGALPDSLAVRGIFQPAEEICQGARDMILAGALENVHAILSTHVDPSLRAGRIGIRDGILTAAVDEIHIEIEGRGGHAARPHESVDPIVAAAQLISSVYLFVPRATSTRDQVVVTFGEIQGGYNANVIPDRVRLRGTLRTLDTGVQTRTRDHIVTLAAGIAATSGTTISVDFPEGTPPVINDPVLSARLRETCREVVGESNIVELPHPSMGGEDFAFYLEQVPGCMIRVGSSFTDEPAPPLHSPDFDIEESALAVGARILARAAVRQAAR